ncbi:hypothetical protein Tco_0593603 [Tanacetum coccineum]
MTLEVVYQAVHKIKADSTVIQVEAKRLIQRVTPSSRRSRSSDHRRSRRDSPEYDSHEGRAVSRRYIDDKDYRDRSEPSSRQGRDNRDYDIKRSKYETSRRTPGIAHLQIGAYFVLEKGFSIRYKTIVNLVKITI